MDNTPTTDSESGVTAYGFPTFDNDHSPQASLSISAFGSRSSTSLSKTSSRGRDVSTAMFQRQPTNTENQVGHVGQFSLGPALQTTTVTTTTTTTMALPPLVLKSRKSLLDRDPNLYPLAASDTPDFLKRIAFQTAGVSAVYEETADGARITQEWDDKQSAIQASNGILRTKSSNEGYETPTRHTKHASKVPSLTRTSASTSKLGPRLASEPVLAQAAEIAEQQRRGSKRARMTAGTSATRRLRRNMSANEAESDAFPTPDSELQNKLPSLPPSKRPALKTNLKSSLRHEREEQKMEYSPSDDSASGLFSSRDDTPDYSPTSPNYLPASPKMESIDHSVANPNHSPSSPKHLLGSPLPRSNGVSFAPTVLDGPGVSATPPIAETDLEPLDSFGASEAGPSRPRPAPLDTLVANDASLPSPSLSPVTAAANHGINDASLASTETDDDDMSGLDLIAETTNANTLRNRRTFQINDGKRLAMPDRFATENEQLPTPTLMDLPTMIEAFDAVPDEMKTYLMFQFLRMCPRSTLHVVADTVNPALKMDFLGRLPPELSINIIRYLDVQSLCRAAQVSKRWRSLINSDEKGWKDMLEIDGFVLPDGELTRAVKEGWGWQYPHDISSYERDLSADMDIEASSDLVVASSSGRSKRKSSGRTNRSTKKRKLSPSTGKGQTRTQLAHGTRPWMQMMSEASGPARLAQAAEMAVTNPNVGIPSLRSMHLYKTLYQRQHTIRRNWLHEDTQPQHLAFKAHGRHVVTCLQFDTDKILTGSDDTHINVYETKTGKLRAKLHGHDGGVWALQYEGNILVSGSTDRSVRVWDIERRKCLQVFQGHTSTVRCLQILKPTKIGENADGSAIMMPKQPLIITGSRDSTLRIWKLPDIDDEPVAQGEGAVDGANPYFVRVLSGHQHSVRAIAAYADTLVSGSYDTVVRVWKISTGEVIHRLTGHSQKVYSVVLDHERNRCISGSMDYLVKVWSLESGQCLFNLEGHSSLVGLLDLSHDRLVSAAADSTLRIWDPDTGLCKSTLTAHTGAITCFQHDGQKVISGSDRTLKMWNVKTGECIKDLLTDLSGVWQVKFNDRRCVAAVQRDQTTYIEVLDFGAARDGVPADQRGRRISVNRHGQEIDADNEEAEDPLASAVAPDQ